MRPNHLNYQVKNYKNNRIIKIKLLLKNITYKFLSLS